MFIVYGVPPASSCISTTGSSTSDRRAALCKEKKTVQLLAVVGCFCSLLMKLCLDYLTKPLQGEPIPKYQSSDIRFKAISNRYEMHLCPQGRAPPISFWNILLMNLIKAGQAKQKNGSISIQRFPLSQDYVPSPFFSALHFDHFIL